MSTLLIINIIISLLVIIPLAIVRFNIDIPIFQSDFYNYYRFTVLLLFVGIIFYNAFLIIRKKCPRDLWLLSFLSLVTVLSFVPDFNKGFFGWLGFLGYLGLYNQK